jgi:hypothetical protein
MPKRVVLKALEIVLATLAVVISCFSQKTPTITQKTRYSTCSNIIALAGNVSVKCSSLTPTQKKLIGSIPALLNKIISSQLDPNLLMKKIDELEASVKEIHVQQEFSGSLLPANDPTPENACSSIPQREGTMLMILGNSASLNPWFPHTVIRAKGEDVLTLNKKDNAIAIGVKIFGGDGRIVAEIRDNEFSINPNNYFRKERPDNSTLIVYDQEDRKVLDVRFLNSNTVRFSGVLNYPHSLGPLVISPTEGFFAHGLCAAYGNIDFNIR